MGISNWNDIESRRAEKGEMAATWQRLGNAAGSVLAGVSRIQIESGRLSTPPHSHGASEEIFYVLGGSGYSWQDEQVYEVRAGDCIVHVADREEHTLRGGDDGLDVLVFGTRHQTEIGWLPRSGAIRIGWPWVQGRMDDPWDIEATSEPLNFDTISPRPKNIVNVDELEDYPEDPGSKALAETCGSVRAGLHWTRRPPNTELMPPHCHSAEEEIFVVLEGDGVLELWPSARRGGEPEVHPLRVGDLVARPPGTAISHCLRAGDDGFTVLTYGTRDPNDMAYKPRTGKIYIRGLGVVAKLEQVDWTEGD